MLTCWELPQLSPGLKGRSIQDILSAYLTHRGLRIPPRGKSLKPLIFRCQFGKYSIICLLSAAGGITHFHDKKAAIQGFNGLNGEVTTFAATCRCLHLWLKDAVTDAANMSPILTPTDTHTNTHANVHPCTHTHTHTHTHTRAWK